jgi:UDP-N-acetylglucosamine 4-epimerase
VNQVYNIACGNQVTLNDVWKMIAGIMHVDMVPEYGPERPGDIKHSLADIQKAKNLLGYTGRVDFLEGLQKTSDFYNLL